MMLESRVSGAGDENVYKCVNSMSDLGPDFCVRLGQRLRAVRVKSGLTLRVLGTRLGMKTPGGASYLVRLEKGKLHHVRLITIVGYLKACNEPVGRFFLDLFPDPQITPISQIEGRGVESGFESRIRSQEEVEREKQARARMMKRMRKQARRERRAGLQVEIEPIVGPYLVGGHEFRLDTYVKAANDMLRIGKKIMARAGSAGNAEALKVEFDRIERENPSWYLNPEALHLVRKMIESKIEDSIGKGIQNPAYRIQNTE
jgi:transcriptional regulator with XRE-family HTH domain